MFLKKRQIQVEILQFNAFSDGNFNMLSYFHILFLKLLIYIQLLS